MNHNSCFTSVESTTKKRFCKPTCKSLPHQYYHSSAEDTPVTGGSIIPAPTAARVHCVVSLARKLIVRLTTLGCHPVVKRSYQVL
jgi:hypothetical protein